jgi:hypothetical protein
MTIQIRLCRENLCETSESATFSDGRHAKRYDADG